MNHLQTMVYQIMADFVKNESVDKNGRLVPNTIESAAERACLAHICSGTIAVEVLDELRDIGFTIGRMSTGELMGVTRNLAAPYLATEFLKSFSEMAAIDQLRMQRYRQLVSA